MHIQERALLSLHSILISSLRNASSSLLEPWDFRQPVLVKHGDIPGVDCRGDSLSLGLSPPHVDNSVNGRRLTETVSTDESQVLKRGKRRRSVEMVFGQKHRLEREAHPEEEGRLTNSSYKIAGTFFDIKTDDG
jgi:hypothetical protein